MVFPATALYPQQTATAVDTTNDVVARKLAAIPLEVYLADSNLHIINVYKLQATILRESRGRSPDAIIERLTREVYTPYSAFWRGYMGDEAAFRRWAATSFLAVDHPVRTRLAAWLDLRLDLLFTAGSRWVVQTTGRRPRGRWYLVFGPGWTDMGGFTDGTMLVDLSQQQMLPDSADLTLRLAHELTHEVTGADSADADAGTVLSRMVSEGLASYATYVYGMPRSLTPAQALGYTEGEWVWALAHETDLIAAARSTLYSRERADLNRVASRSERLVDGGPTAAGYFLGFRMVQAYVKGHGPASWTDLLRLPVREVLTRSDYPLPCPPFDTTAAWARANRSWSNERGVRWSNDSLRRVLLTMRDRDQAPRAEFGARFGDSLYARNLMRVDSSLAAEMSGILDRFGLPTRAMVGPAGSDAAMLIVQHSWPLQERVLSLAQAVPAGEISPEKLGMLEDRVLVHRGKPQRFGTQFNAGPDGVFRFAPVSDTAGLDARRAAAGMPPLAQYVCLLEESGMHVDRASLPLPRP